MTIDPSSQTSSIRFFTRRDVCALGIGAGLGAFSFLAGCKRSETVGSKPVHKQLIVYCSADADVASPIFREFSRLTTISVLPVFDTEATKTTGLVNRLLQEKDRPRADVWWSSEPLGTIRLAHAGVLQPYRSESAELSMGGAGWPASLKDANTNPTSLGQPRWYGFASRARVLGYNTNLLSDHDIPKTLEDLAHARLKGKLGMARPEFGTTRTHIAAWHAQGILEDTLAMLKAQDVRLYDGNSSVARALGRGEIFAGFVDTDDVYAAQREKWPVELVYLAPTFKTDPGSSPSRPRARPVAGTLVLPNTVALVRQVEGDQTAAPHPFAAQLLDFLLSQKTQRQLVQSDSHNIPVDPVLEREFARFVPPGDRVVDVDLSQVHEQVERALEICSKTLKM